MTCHKNPGPGYRINQMFVSKFILFYIICWISLNSQLLYHIYPCGSYLKLSHGAIITGCSNTFFLFKLRKISVTVETHHLSFRVLFIWSSLHIFDKVSSFFFYFCTQTRVIFLPWGQLAILFTTCQSNHFPIILQLFPHVIAKII